MAQAERRRTARPAGERLQPVHVGCSGWNYRDWRGSFYPAELPANRWLEHYARQFETVEVNTTFYRLIARDAVAHWIEQTPEGFIFAVKASRYLTHVKRLTNIAEGIARFYERLQPMLDARRLGPVLWQLPESFHRDDEGLAAALEQLPPGRHAFELRHSSWFAPEGGRSSRPGPSGCTDGARAGRSSLTSTTTGRPSPPATPPSCSSCSTASQASAAELSAESPPADHRPGSETVGEVPSTWPAASSA